MSYNTTSSQLASVLRTQLAQIITDARRTVTDTERPLIELAGQSIACVLDGVPDDVLVDMQLHGSDLPSQDARVWFVSITTKRITPKPEDPKVDKPWDRSQGPMIARDEIANIPAPVPAIPPTEPSPVADAPTDATADQPVDSSATPARVASPPAPNGVTPPTSPPNKPMMAAPGDTTAGT